MPSKEPDDRVQSADARGKPPLRASRRDDDARDDERDADPKKKSARKGDRGGKAGKRTPLVLGLVLGGVGCLGLIAIVAVVGVGFGLWGFMRAPAWEFGGKWPDPQRPQQGDVFNTVTFHVAGCADEFTREEVAFKIGKIADPAHFTATSSSHEGDRMAVHLTPVASVEACAKRVDFGEVKMISGKTITVLAAKVPGPKAQDPISVAVYFLGRPMPNKRQQAVRELRKTEPNERRTEVAKALEGSLRDADASVRVDAIEAYGMWAAKENSPTLFPFLRDENVWVREKTIFALGRLKDERSIEPIADRLGEPFDGRHAGQALQGFGPAAEKALIARARHPKNEVREEVCRILGVIGTAQCVPALIDMLQDKQGNIRQMAMQKLAQLKDPRGIEPIAERLTEFFDRGDAKKALEAYGAAAEPALIARLNHREKDVRIESCRILAKIGTAQSIAPLQKLVAENDFFIKGAAEEALKTIQRVAK